MLSMGHEDIITRLRAISNSGQALKVVVAREAPSTGSDEDDLAVIDVSSPT